MKPKLRTALYFAGAIIIAALISAGVTMQLYNQNRKDAVMLSTDEYAALTDILALDEIISDIQSDYYYDAPSREALITAAARGMVSELNDPYAQYFTDEEYQKYLTSISGSYDGIGVLLGQPTEQGAEILDVAEQQVTVGVRPEHVIIGQSGIPAKVDVSEMMGSSVHLHMSALGGDMIAIVPLNGEAAHYPMGMDVKLSFGGHVVHVFSKDDSKNLEW